MKFLFVIFLLPLQLFAQDITGVWTGTLYSDSTQFIKYELAISEYNGKLSGYSHTIFVIDGVENIGVKSIKIKKVKEDFFVEDDKLVYNNYTEPPAKGVKKYSDLSLSQNDTTMILSGLWKTNRTREYKGLTGEVFLQKKKQIRESLIITKLENLGLASSLSFMTSPSQTKEAGMVNKPVYNPGEPKKPVNIAKDVVSTTTVAGSSEIQQADQQRKTDKQSEEVMDKEGTKKDTTQIRGVQLPVEDMSKQKAATAEVTATSKSTKSGTQQNDKPRKAGVKTSGVGLNKVDSVNKDIIKEIPLPIPEISTPKNKASNIASIKSATQQTSIEQKAGKKIPGEVLNKVDSGNKDLVKVVPPLQGMSAPKNEPTNIGSIRSATQPIGQQQQTGKKIPRAGLDKGDSIVNKDMVKVVASQGKISAPGNEPTKPGTVKSTQQTSQRQQAGKIISEAGLNKVDSGMNKDIVKAMPPSRGEMSLPKNEPTKIGSVKSTQQIGQQQQTGKVTGIFLKKDDSVGISRPAQQLVLPPAAGIATRKIETIRSVDIKSDSLLLTLYDNGEIDGDTVSVLLNGKVIMPKQGLMSKAINKTIYLTPEMGDSIALIMYAENLGSIPPNTGLLVIHDGDDTYEIRFSGDLEKNSSIILKRKRKK